MSSRSLRRNRRAAAAGALAATLGFAGLGLAASPASAVQGFELERLAGVDRIETAVEISQDTFDSANTALIARADLYPDALAGNYLAGAEGAPILLSHTDEVPAETLAELERLGAENVILLGGTAALSQGVHDQLTAAGFNTTREAGTDRYETAAEIATSQDAAGIGEVDGARTAILATGERFPDALTGGPLAYAGSHPILLTPTATLGEDAAGALEALGIEHVLILGGSAAVSEAAEAQVEALGITTERLAGATRYDTATDIAEWALANAGFTDEHINVATGRTFPDALTGGPHAGEEVTPIILANEGNTAEAVAYITDHADTLVDGHIFGGTAAVSAAVEAALEAAGQGAATNQSFTANQQAVNRQLAGTPGAGTGGVIEYRFSGLDAARDYDVALVQCGDDGENEDVLFNGGFVSFADQDLNDQADGLGDTQTGEAVIATVGFTAIGTPYADDVSPDADGTLLVRLDSQDADCAYVVVFDDNADDDILNLDPATTNSYNNAVDKFGVAGPAVYHFGEAATGSDLTGEVVYVDKDANFFVLDTGYQYLYSAEDTGYYDGAEVDYALTNALFEQYLSIGDYLDDFSTIDTGSYSRTNPNVFQFSWDTPNQPAGVTLSATNADAGATSNDILATVTPATPLDGDVDQYCVELSSVAANGTLTYVDDICTDEVNTVGTGDADNTVVFANQADGNYVARAYADSETDDSSYYSAFGAPFALDAVPNDTVAPTISDLRVTTDTNTPGVVSDTDVIRFTFTESMDPTLDNSGVFRFTDATGETYQVSCVAADTAAEGEATCALSATDLNLDGDTTDPGEADSTLTVTLVDAPVKVAGAGDGAAQLDGTLTQLSAQFQDVSGNDVNLAGSADKVIDNEL